jgi:hypothetical protein
MDKARKQYAKAREEGGDNLGKDKDEENDEENIEEEDDSVGYMPPRPLKFNHKGEMQLFALESAVTKQKRIRQLPLLLSTGLFTYLIMSNLNHFSFETATIGTYFKLMAYWIFGWTPSVYFLRIVGRASGKNYKLIFNREDHC